MTDWVAVDWGTSNLRYWVMRGSGDVVRQGASSRGMGTLSVEDYEAVLLDALAPEMTGTKTWPVVICGMAGSRQGWREAPYRTVPCQPPTGVEAVRVPTRDARLAVHILPGIKQDGPADVMRGEETQVAGFLALNPRFDGVICLPGTHCKWVHISAGEIISFRTYMTGEMFALLSGQSVLRHSVQSEDWDQDAFLLAVDHAMSRPAGFAADLFSLRAEALLQGLQPQAAKARLSGLLIGMELAAARPYWLGQQVAILGASALASAYSKALETQGLPVLMAPAERMTLEGLKAAHAALKETQA